MSFKPSEVIKNKRQPSTFNYKRHLQDRIGADTYNTDIEQFNKDYGADYLSGWHTADEINSYYDRLASITDRTKAYQSYVNLYGTDEQKAVLGDIDKQVSAYDEIIGARKDVLDYYGSFADADAYAKGQAYAEEQRAADQAEQERIASLDLDAVRAEIADLEKEIAQYESNKKKVYAVPNTNVNEVQAYARSMDKLIEDKKNQIAAREADVAAREVFDRKELYSNLLKSDTLNSFVPTNVSEDDKVAKAKTVAEYVKADYPTKMQMQQKYPWLITATTNPLASSENADMRYSYMEDDEINLYYYLYENYGKDSAEQYLLDIDSDLMDRANEVTRAIGREHPIRATAVSFLTNLGAVGETLRGVITNDQRQGMLSATTTSLRTGVTERSDNDIDILLYNTITSGIDSAIAASIGGNVAGAMGKLGKTAEKITKGVAGSMLGLSVWGSTRNDALSRGATPDQALTSGIVAAVFEGFFESFSIGRLTKMKPADIVKSWKVFAANVAKDIATNASEELATEVANILFDTVYMGELSNASIMLDQYMRQGMDESEAKVEVAKKLGLQVLEAGASGALMGAGFSAIGGGVGLAKTDSAQRQLGKNQIKEGNVESLLTDAKELFKDAKYKDEQALIKKVEANLGKKGPSQQRNVGKLTGRVISTKFRELNKQVAEQSLENVAETRKNVESETKKLKVNSSSAEINYDNMPQILGFEGANLDKTMVETEQGAVKLTDMEISNAEIGDLYAYAVRLGSTESANAFIQNWDQTTDPLYYWLDWTKLQTRGLYAPEKMEKAMSDYSDVKLSPAAKLAAFKSGMSLRTSAREKMEADSAKLKETYKELGGKVKKGKFDDSKLNYSALTKEQKDVVNFTRILSDYLGVNITYFKSEKGKRGANGYYRAKNNTIYLDIYAGIGNKESYSAIKDCLVNTVSHEVVHNMAVNAPAEYGALRDFVIERLSEEEGFDLDSRVEQIMLENSDQGFTAEDAIEEIVAMSCENLLGSSERLQEAMTQFYAKNEKAANSFTKYVREVLNRLKQFFEKIIGKKSVAEESQLMAKQSAEFISELQKRYDAALLAVGEGNAVRNTLGNLTATEQVTLAESGIAVDETTGDVHKVRNSVRYSTANKDAQGNIIDLVTVGKKSFNTEAIAKLVSTATGRSIEDARKWVRSEMAIANLVMDNPEFLDFEPDDRYQGIKKNSDYPQGTVDLSNLCPKREEFTTMFDLLQKKYPDKLFTAADVASMREILKKHGITVACGACFVEDRRQLLGEIADTYINMWREAVENGTPLQKTNAEGKKIKLQVTAALAKQYGLTKGADIMATDKYIPTQYDLTTYEGFKLLEKNHPLVAMGFKRYNNSRGQQAGRLIEGRAEYDRQILGWTPNKVKTVNNNGGLRIFSFSDFEVVHLLDLVQVIIDCAAMGVKIQGYTKIPAFARLVRNTGIKLNRSLIPKGETGIKVVNGKEVLDIDLVEGINIEDENFLDESDNDNVGNIIIGINPKQIGIAMLDDFIDYIIPFHTNKSKDICRKLGVGEWNNYKESQHEKDIETGKASKHNVNIYTQVINKYHPKNKIEFVGAFLKECRSQKKVPRYSEFLYKEYKPDGSYSDEGGKFDYTYGEGYHKLLVDFKMFDKEGNILPQGDIVPELDDAFMAELLDKEKARKKDYTFPQEVYDEIDRVFGDGDRVMRQARAESEDEAILDLSDNNDLSKLVDGVHGALRYKTIANYILTVLGNEAVILSDGTIAVVDKRDAMHIANKSGNVKAAHISKIKEIIEKARLYAYDNNVNHKKFSKFLYYEVMVKYRDEQYPVYLNVGLTINDKTYHIYDITKKIEDTANRINGLERPKPNEGYAQENDIFTNRISQPEQNVNPSDEKIRGQQRIETPGASEVLSELFRDNPNLNGYADQRKELKSYQELLRSVKVNEQRIAEIDAEIKSLKSQKAQGGKGTRMAQLYEMRKTAEDRVTEKKNRMFKIEATSLRDVVTKETARLLQERTEEERSLSRQKQKDIRENYARREYIKKIEQRAKGLQEAITKAGQKHIPEPFKKVVSDLITSIDFSSKRSLAGKGETKKEMQIKSAMRGLSDLMTSNTLSSENEGKNSSEEIQGFLMACDITGEFAQEFDSLYKEIDAISEAVGNDTDLILQRMSSEQLKRLNSALYKLSGQISKVNKLMENNLYKDIPEMSYDFLQFAKQFRLKGDISVIERLLDTDQLIPYYAFKRMGKVGLALFNEWANGFDQYAKLSKKIVDTTENLYTAKEVKRWTNEVHEFTIRDQKYYFTTAHLMSFYLLHKQEDSKRHLEGYGMAVESFKTDNLKQYKNSVTGTFLTESDIVTLLTELEKDKRAIEVAEKLQQFMATECADWANYITMRRFGEKAYTIKDYFPIESSKADMNTEKGAGGFMSLYYLLNKSFTKARVLNANNKIMIRDIFDVFSNHTTEVAAYRSFGLPLLDMLKFYNYQYTAEVIADKQVKSDRKSVKGIMEDVFGKGYKNYIESFIRDVTGANPPVEETAITKVVSGLVSKTKVAAVAFNLRVVALQGTSYIRAGAVLKQRYLLQEIKDTPQLRRAMETMNEYSGIAVWKNELGFRDVNITRGLQEKIKHKDTVWDKVTEASMKGAELGDRMTWGAIWLACENEIKDTQKNLAVGKEAFNEAVATRFREVIYATQVVDSPLAKSHVMRRKDIYHRFATNFMSEPTVSYNLLLDSYYEAASAKRRGVKLSRKNYRQIGKLAVVYIQSAIVQAIYESFIDALRRRANDEEDETLLNAYVDELWRNVLKELSVLRKIPYLKNVSDLAERYWFNGFSYNNQMEISAFEKPIKFIADFTDFVMGEDVSITKLVKSLLEALSSTTGLPLGNVYRTVRTIWNNVVEMFNDGSGRIE